MKKPVVRLLFVGVFVIAAAFTALGRVSASPQASKRSPSDVVFPIFWTWSDRQIEDRALMTREIDDIKAAGYGAIYAMVRATRYNLFDPEVTEAAVFASRLCRERGLPFIWGADPRFGATHIVRKTGYGAGARAAWSRALEMDPACQEVRQALDNESLQPLSRA